MPSVRAHLYISGVVQGVFFRSNTRDKALGLGLQGWVRNLQDGRVEAVVQGENSEVREMIEWCKAGPPSANVDDVDVRWEEYGEDLNSFEVRYF